MSKFYDAASDQVLDELSSNQYTGLTRKEAGKRLRNAGRNLVYPVPRGRFGEYLIHMLTDYTSILLIISAILCLIFEHDVAAVIITVTLFFSYLFCTLVYLRAQKVLENMGSFALPVVKVMRDGRLYMCRSEQIVKGDIIFLCAGDVVPADCRILTCENFVVDEEIVASTENAFKDASFIASSAVDLPMQKNMVFAASIVKSGSAKAVVCYTGGDTAVKKMNRTEPVVSYDDLRILERIRSLCGKLGIIMLCTVFVFTLISIFLGKSSIFDNLFSFLSLAVASMAEMYIAFGYIVVACGIFGAMRQYKDINSGALIKNSSKLDSLCRTTYIAAPKIGCFLVDELVLEQIYCDDILYSTEEMMPEKCLKILEHAVISTGIYGGKTLVSINSAQNNVFTTEENAIIFCAQNKSIYNYNLDNQYPLLDHRDRSSSCIFDSTLVQNDDKNLLIVRGEASLILSKCTYHTENGERVRLSSEQSTELLLTAKRMSIGGYKVCAIASRYVSDTDLSSPVKLHAHLNFEGFIALRETVLPDAAKNIRICRDSGIHVIMFSGGDDKSDITAARSLGIITGDDEILSGKAMENMNEGVLIADINKYSLFVGLSVSQKRKILNILQSLGESVAYLASSPDERALLADADISFCQSTTISLHADKGGVDTMDKNIPVMIKSPADGEGRGCDALKGSCDVIVSSADKNGNGGFNAIVKSISVARSVYENLYHMFSYLVCSQLARFILVVLSVFVDFLVFSPVQIIISGLIVDFAAVTVFAFDKPKSTFMPDKDVYEKKLRSPLKSVLPSVYSGLGLAFICFICSLVYYLFVSKSESILFVSFVFSQLICIFEYRSDKSFTRSVKIFNNVFAATAVSTIVIIGIALTVPSVSEAFNVNIGSKYGYLFALIPAAVVFIVFEIIKYFSDRKTSGKENVPFFMHKRNKDEDHSKTEEYIKSSFKHNVDAEIDYSEPTLEFIEEPERTEPRTDENIRYQLVRLSIQCTFIEKDPCKVDEIAFYDGIIDSISPSVTPESDADSISYVLMAAFLSYGCDVSSEVCLECAKDIVEKMKI